MRSFLGLAARIVLLLGLATFVFLKGIVPALSGIGADFPGYFTAAKIVADGQNADKLYDDVWFRDQIRRYGLESAQNPGKFAPFPPPTALLLVPLTPLDPLSALRVVTAVSVLCLMGSTLLLARILSWGPLDSALFVLSSGLGIVGCLLDGQPYILISTFCILGYFLYLSGRPWLAGICLGVFVPIKYYPIIILAYLAFQKEWKVVLGGAAAILGVALVSIGVLGWKVHEIFLVSVLGSHLMGRLSLQDHTVPFTAVYQSFDTLFNRLFIFDPAWNSRPFLPAPLLRIVGLVITKGAVLLAAVAALVSLARRRTKSAVAPSVGILGILVLLIAPATATYTCVLLWLPVALLIKHFISERARVAAYFMLGTNALIGFIPYGHTYRFEGRGGLTVLAYPRLLLVLAMFIGALYFIAQPRLRDQRDAHLVV